MNRYNYSSGKDGKGGEWGLVAVDCPHCKGKGVEPRTEFNNMALPLTCRECNGARVKHEKKYIRFGEIYDE